MADALAPGFMCERQAMFRILSLDGGIKGAFADSGISRWNAGLVKLMVADQMEVDLAQAKLLLNGRLLRIDVTARESESFLDNVRPVKIQRLINLRRGEVVKKNLEIVTARFLNGVASVYFMPFHQPVS